MGSTTGQQEEVKAKWSPVFMAFKKINTFIKNWNDFAFTGTQLGRGHGATPLYLRWMWVSPVRWVNPALLFQMGLFGYGKYLRYKPVFR